MKFSKLDFYMAIIYFKSEVGFNSWDMNVDHVEGSNRDMVEVSKIHVRTIFRVPSLKPRHD